jgi:adenosylcobinamide-GDP ribazoletransferase
MGRAVAFLTTLGRATTPDTGALVWFPVVGAALGTAVGAVWLVAEDWWTPFLAAVLAVAADLALTGLLHVDGLADSADGLLAQHQPRSRRLEIMRAPDVGAYGVAVVAVVLLARTAALAGQAADVALVAGLWMASRTVMAVVPTLVPYAREQGLATPFLGRPAHRALALALVPAALLAGVAPVVGLVVAAAALILVARRRLGGFTGDVLGAAAVVGETVGLIVAAGPR